MLIKGHIEIKHFIKSGWYTQNCTHQLSKKIRIKKKQLKKIKLNPLLFQLKITLNGVKVTYPICAM